MQMPSTKEGTARQFDLTSQIMMIRLLEFGLLLFAIRKAWWEPHLQAIAAAIAKLLRRLTVGDAPATQAPKMCAIPRRTTRAQLKVAVPALRRKYWRSATGTLNGFIPRFRLRRRPL